MSENLFTIFKNRFPADLSKVFLWRPDGSALSYADLVELSGRLANALKSLGVKPGDRVAAQVEKSAEALLVYLAALRAGAVYLPLNSAYTASEIRYFLGDAEPTLFICRPESAAEMQVVAAEAGVPRVETLGSNGEGSLMEAARAQPPAFEDVERTRDDLAAILYTSGTTGRSKGAMLSHGNLASNAEVLRDNWRFTPEDRLLHALPIFHTHGLFVATNVTLMTGSSLIFLPTFNANEIVRLFCHRQPS
jgi:malonyl-CoA/methylmalonyl-CoA synthetase